MMMRSTSSACMRFGGTCGALATGFLASDTINANLDTNVKDLCDWSKGHLLYVEQLKAIGVTIALSVVGTALIGYILKFTIGPAPDGGTGRSRSGHLRSRRRGIYPLVSIS